MPRYDFKSLSSQDFEELVRDLLQAEWDVALEAFKTGRDSGIDLRYVAINSGSTIIQCKHYAVSGFNKLLTHLRDCERPKVERLNPTRYVVVTSVELTPGNKDSIVEALYPFILRANDILGADDLEGLLSRHQDVERAHFKLWLTSTTVLERVLHNAELCHTDFQIDRIRRKLPLFVKNDAFPRARALLDENCCVIVSGVPGIGKTTLAEMLLYAHLEEGYEPVVIQAEVAEGKKLFKPAAKQLFYYDDFLGQTFLGDRREYLGRNEDATIIDFMEMIRQSSHARFILTTREHVLSSALQISERLRHSLLLQYRCVLTLADYSYGQRARILYNHLYFSDLPPPYKEAVLEGHFFLEIIKHKHFNPRLIEWLSTHARLRNVAPEAYRVHVSALLESPNDIWSHAFHKQISEPARHVLLSLYTLGEWTDTVDLEPVFMSHHRYSAATYNHRIAPGDFRNALQELDGAFLSYSSGRASYLNPSIREFVASVIANERETTEALLNSAVRFKQVVNLWYLSESRPNSVLRALLTSDLELLYQSSARLLHGPSLRWEQMEDGTRRGYPIDWHDEAKIGFLVEVAETQKSTRLAALAHQVAERLIASWDGDAVDLPPVLQLLKELGNKNWFLTDGGRELYRKLLDGVLGGLVFARADDWLAFFTFSENAKLNDNDDARVNIALEKYLEQGVVDERMDCSSQDEMIQLMGSLEELKKKFGLDVTRHIKWLAEDIAAREQTHDDERREGGGYSRSPSLSHGDATDEDVRQMFSTLTDER